MLVDKYLNMYVKVEKPTTNILMYVQKRGVMVFVLSL